MNCGWPCIKTRELGSQQRFCREQRSYLMRAASALEPPLISSDTGRSPSFLESKSWPSRSQELSRAFCEENRFVVEISTNFAVKYLSLYLSSNSFEGSRGGRQREVVRERRRRRNSTSRCEIDDSSHGRWRDPEMARVPAHPIRCDTIRVKRFARLSNRVRKTALRFIRGFPVSQ